MKNKKCPSKRFCHDYLNGNCDNCATGVEITKLHKRIDRLKKQNETLTIQRNAWALTAKAMENKWISVDERLPEPSENCLVAAKVGDRVVIDLGSLVPGFDYTTNECCCEWMITNDWDEGEGCEITHWMPLPEPPKMKGEDNE